MNWALRALGRNAPFKYVVDYSRLDNETLTACPACGACVELHAVPFAHLDRYGFPVQTMWCRACDLLFVNPRPTSVAYNKFYDEGVYRRLIAAFSGHEDDHLLPQERVRQLASLMKSHVPQRSLSVLNIGGTRSDYDVLSQHIAMSRYVCLNPGEKEAGEGYEVIPQSLETYVPRGETFDVICLLGTLNHLTQPGEAFNKIANMMSMASVFVFDFKDPVVKMMRMAQPIGGLQFDHAVYPTRRTLGIMLETAGMRLHAFHTDNQRLYTFIATRDTDLDQLEIVRVRESTLIEALRRRTTRLPRRLALLALRAYIRRIS